MLVVIGRQTALPRFVDFARVYKVCVWVGFDVSLQTLSSILKSFNVSVTNVWILEE